MGDEQAFGAALRQVKEAGLIPEDQVRLCAISHFLSLVTIRYKAEILG